MIKYGPYLVKDNLTRGAGTGFRPALLLVGTTSAILLKHVLLFLKYSQGWFMTSSQERRRFGRIMVSLPMEYQTRCPITDNPCQGQGVLRDISLDGTYFHVDADISFQPGQLLSLTIFAPLPYLEDSHISHLQASGEVIRFDPPGPDRPQAGVALSFLEGPTFCTCPAPRCFKS
jgi:hypothetical protein